MIEIFSSKLESKKSSVIHWTTKFEQRKIFTSFFYEYCGFEYGLVVLRLSVILVFHLHKPHHCSLSCANFFQVLVVSCQTFRPIVHSSCHFQKLSSSHVCLFPLSSSLFLHLLRWMGTTVAQWLDNCYTKSPSQSRCRFSNSHPSLFAIY